MKKTDEQKLFELVQGMGETLDGVLHIIDTSDSYPCEDEQSFRVYHKDGYCFDVKKEAETEDEKTGKVGYAYMLYSEWDDFQMIDAKKAMLIINNSK